MTRQHPRFPSWEYQEGCGNDGDVYIVVPWEDNAPVTAFTEVFDDYEKAERYRAACSLDFEHAFTVRRHLNHPEPPG